MKGKKDLGEIYVIKMGLFSLYDCNDMGFVYVIRYLVTTGEATMESGYGQPAEKRPYCAAVKQNYSVLIYLSKQVL